MSTAREHRAQSWDFTVFIKSSERSEFSEAEGIGPTAEIEGLLDAARRGIAFDDKGKAGVPQQENLGTGNCGFDQSCRLLARRPP